jgi:hypothetical protein
MGKHVQYKYDLLKLSQNKRFLRKININTILLQTT